MKTRKKKPLVSIIVTTYNNSATLRDCLDSIKNQTYQNIELIIVDNYSKDNTRGIAKEYTQKVYVFGPERSAQRNLGAQKSKGEYLYFVDADFVLEKEVVSQCVEKILQGYDAIVIHNTPADRSNLLIKLRKFEVDMYKYDLTNSAARFFKRTVFEKLGGYNEALIAGEDYEIQSRLGKNNFKTGFIKAEAIHLGEETNLIKHFKKIFNYGILLVDYEREDKKNAWKKLSIVRPGYLKNWRRFLRHPFLTLGVIFYLGLKYLIGTFGFLIGKFKFNR